MLDIKDHFSKIKQNSILKPYELIAMYKKYYPIKLTIENNKATIKCIFEDKIEENDIKRNPTINDLDKYGKIIYEEDFDDEDILLDNQIYKNLNYLMNGLKIYFLKEEIKNLETKNKYMYNILFGALL